MASSERKTILLVEDEVIFATALSKKLETFGYIPILAHSGEEALELLDSHTEIHLVLMDIDLGHGMDGTKTAQKILENKTLPIVFHTSHFEQDIVERVKDITRYGYVIKNSGDFVLMSSIAMAFDLFEAHQETKNEYTAMEALKELSEHTGTLLNRITDSVVSLDKNWKYTYLNEPALSNFKKTREEIIGKSIWEIFPDIIGTELEKKLKISMQKQVSHEFENYYEPYNMSVRIRCYPSKDGVTLLYQDITKSKEDEKKAKEATNLLYSVVENIPNMIFIKRADNLRFVLFNRAGENLLGYQKEELLGKNDYDFFPKEQADFFTDKDKDVLATREILDIKEEFINTPKGTRILHTKKLPLLDDQGKPEYLLGISEDITERKASEEKVKTLLEEKELLLKEVHHRIKNNMLTIISLLFLQKESLSDSAAITALDDASSRIQSMLVLYDKLYRSTDFKELSIPTYLPSLIDEIISNFPNHKIIKIEKNIDDFILPSSILFPIGIMVNEILTNAMKYAFVDRTSGLLSITATKKEDVILFSIQDNGVGMPESIHFANSSGFGLQLVQMLAKQIRGKVDIERNQGTKFTLEFKFN